MEQSQCGNRKRVFFLVSHSSAGGAQEIWVNLAEQFHARDYEVKLFALYPLRKDVRKAPPELPWHYVVKEQPRNLLDGARLFLSLVKIFKRDRPNFVLTALPAANVLAAAAARLSGAGVSVITSHHSPATTYNRFLNAIDSMTGSLRSVVGIVCVSNFVKNSLSDKPQRYLKKAVTIKNALPPGIDARLATLRRDPAHPTGRRIVATGRLAFQKNYPVLIKAARYLNDAEIVIVGGGPDETELKQLASDFRVSDRVRFMGHMPREEALAVLASCDVFVQPSRFEGHSLALIEAAKVGLPLVVSDIPVQVEGLTADDGEICGLVVGLEDERKLAEEMQRLLDDPEYRCRWGDSATKLASGITFEKVIRAYERVMRNASA